MSGAAFIVMINLAVSGLIAAAFMAIACYERAREAGRWLALAYLLGVAYYLIEFGIRAANGAPLMVALSAAVLLFAMAAFNVALAIRYLVTSPAYLSLAIVVAGTATAYLVTGLPRHSFTRMIAYQGPYFAMQVVALGVVMAGARQKLDYMLACLLAASALHFLAKPFIAYAAGGWGENPAVYLDSYYAMISQTLGTVFAFAIALTIMVVLVGDILSDATAKSETDTLSGLHNRRGFESRAARALERARRQGLPVAVVACDLDHFKSVNDTYGHAAGDRVLTAFAQFLERSIPTGHVAGRMGGEEFAVLMPGTNLPSARLFAEGARAAFGAMTIDGLPDDRRFTASFGVAELTAGESLEEMMRRADQALYAAKRDGRDRVRTASAEAASTAIAAPRFSWL
jgi:diguanylate cyclase (GGDEF)-like protein